MWDFLIPLLRKAIPSITVESLEDWGTCMATAVVSTLFPLERFKGKKEANAWVRSPSSAHPGLTINKTFRVIVLV